MSAPTPLEQLLTRQQNKVSQNSEELAALKLALSEVVSSPGKVMLRKVIRAHEKQLKDQARRVEELEVEALWQRQVEVPLLDYVDRIVDQFENAPPSQELVKTLKELKKFVHPLANAPEGLLKISLPRSASRAREIAGSTLPSSFTPMERVLGYPLMDKREEAARAMWKENLACLRPGSDISSLHIQKGRCHGLEWLDYKINRAIEGAEACKRLLKARIENMDSRDDDKYFDSVHTIFSRVYRKINEMDDRGKYSFSKELEAAQQADVLMQRTAQAPSLRRSRRL